MDQFEDLGNVIVPEELADKCGCCFQQMRLFDRRMIITEDFEKKFYELIPCEFLSKAYTNIVCGLCYDKIILFAELKQELERNQARLHESLVALGILENVKTEVVDENEIQYENEEYLVEYEEVENENITDEDISYSNDVKQVQSPQNPPRKIQKRDVRSKDKPIWIECSLCELVFATQYQLQKHIKLDHPKVKEGQQQFKCRWCEDSPLMNRIEYRQHMKDVHPEYKNLKSKANKSLVCPICDKTLITNSLDTHMKRMHSNEYHFYCDQCPSKFKLKRDIVFHVKTHIQPEYRERYQCEYCTNTYLGERAMRNHILMAHTDIPKSFICECGASFKTKDRLSYHKRHVHGDQEHVCVVCNKIFKSRILLNTHNAKFHKEQIPCTVCGKLIAQGAFMRKHMMLHEPATFECNFPGCKKAFVRKNTLAEHQASVHGLGEKVNCPHCEIACSTVKILKKHIARNHTNAEKARCEVPGCNHQASRKDYMINHIRTHKDLDDSEKAELINNVKAMKNLPW